MVQASLRDPSWCRALTLTERLAASRAPRHPTRHGTGDADLAARRMQRWRLQAPFATGPSFTQRLALDGLSEDDFLEILGAPIEAIHGRLPAPPAWLAELCRAFACPAPPATPSSEPQPGRKGSGFLAAIEPLLGYARDRLQEAVRTLLRTHSHPPFDPGTVEALLFANLPGQLVMMLSRTFVLELHVARLQGLLQGDTPEERFRSFLRRLHQTEVALALLREYPVLARQLMIAIDNWVAFSGEFLAHLCDDWGAIRSALGSGDDPGVLERVEGGAGDRHRGGRSVLIAGFSSGFRVVYKPRPSAVDAHFQELLTWLNARGDHPPFRTLKLLDRGTHGWFEYVDARGCTSPDEVRRFYARQGGYLALLYALEATDFHYENLIAAGEHPVLIDLESLFHPRAGGMDLTQSDVLAGDTIAYSVLRVGLLPQRLWADAESEGIDLSGLGSTAGQLSPQGVPSWEEAGTDAMRFARRRRAIPGAQNRPRLDGVEVEVLDYAEAIVSGFDSVYRSLREHRDELLAEDGPLARFADDEVRVILRHTRSYGMMLQESFHPDLLRDALERDRFFDRLWVGVERRPHLARVIPAEREDLLQGDIPLFATRPASRDLWTGAGVRIADFLDEPGLSLARRRVRQLGDRDLEQQLWFIRASLATLAPGEGRTQGAPSGPVEPRTSADGRRLLAAARAVGDRLGMLALHGEHDVAWIGLTLSHRRFWTLAPLGVDLYGGQPGVALFLAYLGAVTGETRHTDLARAAVTTLRRQVERGRPHLMSIGGFDGWGGLIYTLTHLGTLWDEPGLIAEAEELVAALPALIERDEDLDIISGAAGCIGSLLGLHRCAPSERTLAAALGCADRLLAAAQPMERGIGWITRNAPTRPLAGFSHGAAGMAWALGEMAALTGEERFGAAARAALAYERTLFCPLAENWPDLRDPTDSRRTAGDAQVKFLTTWCHGAPGIGLARLRLLRHLEDGEIRGEIDAALRTTQGRGFGANHSLCHGDLGNLELLAQAGAVLDDPRWAAQVDRMAAVILESIGREGWRCGNPLGVESPGLMTGLAGIGYGLLRLAQPKLIPSVLVLAPPS